MGEAFFFLLAPFTTCVLMVLMFGYLGIHVLKREIIFIDIALAQIAAVGSALAFVLFHADEHGLLAHGVAFLFTILAAMFYTRTGKHISQIPQEAIIGVSYAVAAAAALFMLALAAGGDVHLEHMLTGSILWADWTDILICAIVFGVIGAFHYVYRFRFIECSDSGTSIKHGAWWDFFFYITMGVVITLSVRIAGVLVIFSLLVMPATFSALFSESWKFRLWIAYAFGIAASIGGLIFSYTFDFSSGPSVVTFLGFGLIIGSIIKWRNKGKSSSK
jgi:zinc/manganese transport system permease protein